MMTSCRRSCNFCDMEPNQPAQQGGMAKPDPADRPEQQGGQKPDMPGDGGWEEGSGGEGTDRPEQGDECRDISNAEALSLSNGQWKSCAQARAMCKTRPEVAENCPRTCGECGAAQQGGQQQSGAGVGDEECVDERANCLIQVMNGRCLCVYIRV